MSTITGYNLYWINILRFQFSMNNAQWEDGYFYVEIPFEYDMQIYADK